MTHDNIRLLCGQIAQDTCMHDVQQQTCHHLTTLPTVQLKSVKKQNKKHEIVKKM